MSAQTVKNLPTRRETWVQGLCWKDPLEEGMATHSSILAWAMPRTEDSGSYSPWGHKESDTTERLTLSLSHCQESAEGHEHHFGSFASFGQTSDGSNVNILQSSFTPYFIKFLYKILEVWTSFSDFTHLVYLIPLTQISLYHNSVTFFTNEYFKSLSPLILDITIYKLGMYVYNRITWLYT